MVAYEDARVQQLVLEGRGALADLDDPDHAWFTANGAEVIDQLEAAREHIRNGLPPKIDWISRGTLCFAELAGASLTIGYVSEDSANLVMVDEQGHVLVDIEVRRLGDADIRSSAQEIGAALLWSRWRCVTPISSAAAAETPPPPAPR